MTKPNGVRVKLIGPENHEAYLRALTSRPPLFKGASSRRLDSEFPRSTDETDAILRTDRTYDVRIYGLFRDSELLGVMRIIPWTKLPYYTISTFFVIRDAKIKFYAGLNLFLNQVTRDMEAEGRWTFYTFARLRPFYRKEMVQEGRLETITQHIQAYRRYDFVTEEIVPAGCSSKSEIFRISMANTVWDCPIIVRRGFLLERFRIEALKASGHLDPTVELSPQDR